MKTTGRYFETLLTFPLTKEKKIKSTKTKTYNLTQKQTDETEDKHRLSSSSKGHFTQSAHSWTVVREPQP